MQLISRGLLFSGEPIKMMVYDACIQNNSITGGSFRITYHGYVLCFADVITHRSENNVNLSYLELVS